MRYLKLTRVSACGLLVTLGIILPGSARELNQSGPFLLNSDQLDRVTAGVSLTAATASAAFGNGIAFAETGAGGASSQTALPGGGAVQSGAVVSTASAFSPRGAGAASASTSGSVPGGTTLVISSTGNMAYPGGQTQISATYVSGGPTFLP
jgi:hypothetical protein